MVICRIIQLYHQLSQQIIPMIYTSCAFSIIHHLLRLIKLLHQNRINIVNHFVKKSTLNKYYFKVIYLLEYMFTSSIYSHYLLNNIC